MPLIEVEAVAVASPDPALLWGCAIDRPHPGDTADGHAFDIEGWALGRPCPVVAVELLHRGAVCRRVPMNHLRPDLKVGFPNVPDAARGGFRVAVELVGLAELEIEVRAVLRDQRRSPIGTVRARRRWREGEDERAGAALVSVVIPCFDHARFLGEAIESALAQTYPHLEVVVVDDGSADNAAAVAARYPGVRYLRQANGGLAAARNAGLRHTTGSYVVFLDADDRLRPEALAAGLACLAARPDCAFAYGHFRHVAADGSPLPTTEQLHVEHDHYLALLRVNFIRMHATVIFRREALESIGGYDSTLKACEDYDLYLRLARRYPVCAHPAVVAEYRRHGTNMSRDHARMLAAAATVRRAQWPHVRGDAALEAAYAEGLRELAPYSEPLASEVLEHVRARAWGPALGGALTLLRHAPHELAAAASPGLLGGTEGTRGEVAALRRQVAAQAARLDALAAVAGAHSRPSLDGALTQAGDDAKIPLVGQVRFGDLRRVEPISPDFGFDRGKPIDRYYIERFLAAHSDDVRGAVLEIGDDVYTTAYGGARVATSDVWHVAEGNPRATIVGDLTCADHVASDAFDCVILTQTLHLIFDVRSAVRTLYRILKPGGVLLATFPGITPISRDEWSGTWSWSLTTYSARRLFEEVFPAANVSVNADGNVLAAVAFLHGLAVEELSSDELLNQDPQYEVLVTTRATKPEGHELHDDADPSLMADPTDPQ